MTAPDTDGAAPVPLRWRVPVLVTGLAALGFGMLQLVSGAGQPARLWSAVAWSVGTLIVHDAVLAPLTLAVGWALTRLLRAGGPRRVVAGGLLVAGCLVLVALPALLTPGVAGNPTATPRDYLGGLVRLLALTATGTVALALLAHRRHRRHGSEQGPAGPRRRSWSRNVPAPPDRGLPRSTRPPPRR